MYILHSVASLESSAFLASSSAVRGLVHSMLPYCGGQPFESSYNCALASWLSLGGTIVLAFPSSIVQRQWDNQICSAQLSSIASGSKESSKTRLYRSLTRVVRLGYQPAVPLRYCWVVTWPYSSWLQALPAPNLGLRLGNEELCLADLLHLCCHLAMPHGCFCGVQVLVDGTHGLSCPRSAGRRSRHSAVNNILARSFRNADIPVVLEPTGLLRGDGKRSDGVTLIPYSHG